LLRRPLPVAHADDAFYSFVGFNGESTAAGHFGQTHATSVMIFELHGFAMTTFC
jgi:hypothetical protein